VTVSLEGEERSESRDRTGARASGVVFTSSQSVDSLPAARLPDPKPFARNFGRYI